MSSYPLKGSVFTFENYFHLSLTSHWLTLWFHLTGCFKTFWKASLGAQWKRRSLYRRGDQFHPWPLVWEDPTCHGATSPCATVLSLCSRAQEPQLLSQALRACAPKQGKAPQRSPHTAEREEPLPAASRESLPQQQRPSTAKNKNKNIKKKKKTLRFLTDCPNIKFELKFF